MKLEDLYTVIGEWNRVTVLDTITMHNYKYDGKDSIPKELNGREVIELEASGVDSFHVIIV